MLLFLRIVHFLFHPTKLKRNHRNVSFVSCEYFNVLLHFMDSISLLVQMQRQVKRNHKVLIIHAKTFSFCIFDIFRVILIFFCFFFVVQLSSGA